MSKEPTVLLNPYVGKHLDASHARAYSDLLEVALDIGQKYPGVSVKLDSIMLGAFPGRLTWCPVAEVRIRGEHIVRLCLPRKPYFVEQVKAGDDWVKLSHWCGWRYFFSKAVREETLLRFLEGKFKEAKVKSECCRDYVYTRETIRRRDFRHPRIA